MLRLNRMRRLSALFLCLMLALSLGLGSAARATEGDACIEVTAAIELGHSISDADQVPADSGKGYPHHHGGCHGHCVGVPVSTETVVPLAVLRIAFLAFDPSELARAAGGPALRPPQG